jgi:hypothetical protein
MAKAPTLVFYNDSTGAVNSCRNVSSSTAVAVSGSQSGQTGFSYISVPAQTAGSFIVAHFTADTGW